VAIPRRLNARVSEWKAADKSARNYGQGRVRSRETVKTKVFKNRWLAKKRSIALNVGIG
jgi:hypothetical protein